MSNIKYDLQGAELYMNDKKLLGRELVDEIVKDVKSTQTFAGYNLPDRLMLTQAQYESIETDTEELGAEGRMFVTPYNVMEVFVVDKKASASQGEK